MIFNGVYTRSLSPHYRYVDKSSTYFILWAKKILEMRVWRSNGNNYHFEQFNGKTKCPSNYFLTPTKILITLSSCKINEILSSRLGPTCRDILLRLGDLNPELQSILYAAFKAFYLFNPPKRFLRWQYPVGVSSKGLANTLYPAKKTVRGEMSVQTISEQALGIILKKGLTHLKKRRS